LPHLQPACPCSCCVVGWLHLQPAACYPRRRQPTRACCWAPPAASRLHQRGSVVAGCAGAVWQPATATCSQCAGPRACVCSCSRASRCSHPAHHPWLPACVARFEGPACWGKIVAMGCESECPPRRVSFAAVGGLPLRAGHPHGAILYLAARQRESFATNISHDCHLPTSFYFFTTQSILLLVASTE